LNELELSAKNDNEHVPSNDWMTAGIKAGALNIRLKDNYTCNSVAVKREFGGLAFAGPDLDEFLLLRPSFAVRHRRVLRAAAFWFAIGLHHSLSAVE